MHNTSTMHLIYQNPQGQEFSQHWQDLTEMGTLVDPETGDDLELIGWHSDTAAATEVEVQAAWHAGLDEGREQGRGKDHPHPSVPEGVEGLMQLAREWCLSWGEWAHDNDPDCKKENAAEAALRAALTTALAKPPAEAFDPSIHPIPGEGQQPAMLNGVEAARVLADFAETAPGRLPGRVQDAIATVRAADNRGAAGVDADEDAYVIEHMGKLLAEIAVIVNGPEPALTRWSYHDLPDKVRALKEAPTAAPAGEAVAYLDIGVGGYLDLGTEKDDDELFKLPPGRHMLGIIGTHGVDGYKAHPPAAEVREVAWQHPDTLPPVAPGQQGWFWVAVRHANGRIYSFPATYLNAMVLTNENCDQEERRGNRYHHGPVDQDEGSFLATGWHDAKEHYEYSAAYSPLLDSDKDELIAWRSVTDYGDTSPPSAPVGVEGLMQLARNWCLAWGEWAHDADPGGAKENAAEAALRAALTTALAQQPAACPKCDGTGEADSGGIHPWGAPAAIPCDCQQPAAVAVRGLPRYGFPDGNEPRPVPCTDGYWTPWHLAQALRNEAHATAAKDVEIEELRADLADYMRIANTEATRAERLAEALLAAEAALADIGDADRDQEEGK